MRIAPRRAACALVILGFWGSLSPALGKEWTPAQFRHFALLKEGDARRGQELFQSEQRLGCTRCHTVDGKASKAGPDLSAVGDKFGRHDLIDAVLTPSASIAAGYSTTTIETKSGDEYAGIIKQATASHISLMGADGLLVDVPVGEVQEQRTSDVSLMPEGLQRGLSLQEFTDLIEYLVTLKQPDHSAMNHQGMPDTIPSISQPVRWGAVHDPGLRFEHPVWFGPVPGSSNVFLVAEHESGKVWRLGGNPQTKTLFLDTGVHNPGARGLLGLAFHPRFTENRRYYLVKQVFEEGQFASVIFEREAASDGAADSGRPGRRVLAVKAATNSDHAGSIVFGPDGYLYIGMGDTGPSEDPQGHGQDTQVLLGKILRIDVDRRAPDQAYVVPPSNPFMAHSQGRPEIWAYGIREPWRFSFDRQTGDLWVGDVGQDRYEEVDLVRAGENFGWNVYEGFEPFSNAFRRDTEMYVRPVFAYRRKFGPCVTGGYVYRGKANASFFGVYVCGDHESRRVFGLTQQDRVLKVVRQIGTAPERIASFAEDSAGQLYVVGYEGTIYRMDFGTALFQ
jgi:putative heme-binding domain-containing protein